VYVAAKVEETPVHIKTVVSESRHCFNEYGIKTFPSDYTKLAEMEFYLLSDLDFHLIVYHPYRTLSALCGREPMDPGTFDDDELPQGGAKERMPLDAEVAFGDPVKSEDMDEARNVEKMFGKGSGKDVGYVEDSILQMAWFILNDTYRTDISLIYPPYIIALAALYLAFIITEKSAAAAAAAAAAAQVQQTKLMEAALSASAHTPGTRTPLRPGTPGTISPSPQLPVISANQIQAMEQGRKIVGRAQAAELFAGLHVNPGTVMRVVQEIVAVYPVWEELDGGGTAAAAAAVGMTNSGIAASLARGQPIGGRKGPSPSVLQGAGSGSAVSSSSRNDNKDTNDTSSDDSASGRVFQPDVGLTENEVVPFLLKMRQARLVDVGHPDDAGDSVTSKAATGLAGGRPDVTRPTKRARLA